MPVLGRLALAIVVVGLLVVLDMRTKGWAAGELRAAGGRTVAGGQVRLAYYENPGIAFGLLRASATAGRQGAVVVFSAAASAVPAGLLAWLVLRRRLRVAGYLAMAGLAVLVGGSLGNLHDRLVRGYVVDFIDLSAGGWLRWPIFNVADVAVAVGFALCVAALLQAWVRSIRRARAGLFLDDDEDQEDAGEAPATAAASAGDGGAVTH